MAAESAKEFEALEAQAATLLDTFRNAGYEQVAPSIIQPADIFLDQIGESIRSRTYVFTDLAGDELCLRPDLTVPVSRLYLERHPEADQPARYCYNGPAFRFQPQGDNRAHPREFRQAGIECFGESDSESADVEIVLLAVEAVRGAGLKDFRLRFGDIALFYALLDALALPERWRLKLRHYFWRPQAFHALLSRLAKGERPNGDGPVMALAGSALGQEAERAEELVAAYLDQERAAARRQPLLERDHRAAARSCRRSQGRALAQGGRHRDRLLPRGLRAAAGGGRARRHDRARAPASISARRFRPITRRFERLKKSGIDLGRARVSPPSSAATSNITQAWCSRSRPRASTRPLPAAGAMTACSPISARRGRCRPSARPSTPSACSPPRGETVMAAKLSIAVPSKGRLKDQAAALFERAGLALRSKGHERGYRGTLEGLDGVEVVYTSAAEIVHQLKTGRVQLGMTGEDLIRETLADVDRSVEFLAPLGFGRADVVVAVPDCWIDVGSMADLEDVAAQFAGCMAGACASPPNI